MRSAGTLKSQFRAIRTCLVITLFLVTILLLLLVTLNTMALSMHDCNQPWCEKVTKRITPIVRVTFGARAIEQPTVASLLAAQLVLLVLMIGILATSADHYEFSILFLTLLNIVVGASGFVLDTRVPGDALRLTLAWMLLGMFYLYNWMLRVDRKWKYQDLLRQLDSSHSSYSSHASSQVQYDYSDSRCA